MTQPDTMAGDREQWIEGHVPVFLASAAEHAAAQAATARELVTAMEREAGQDWQAVAAGLHAGAEARLDAARAALAGALAEAARWSDPDEKAVAHARAQAERAWDQGHRLAGPSEVHAPAAEAQGGP